jgi:hypothetical protein
MNVKLRASYIGHGKSTRVFYAAVAVGSGLINLAGIGTNVKLRASYIRPGKLTHFFLHKWRD